MYVHACIYYIYIYILLTGKFLKFTTPNEYNYEQVQFTTGESPYFVFSVQACNDAHVALSEIPGLHDYNTYELVFGGWANTGSAIREARQRDQRHFVRTPGILSCDEKRTFWVGWKDGLIEVNLLALSISGNILAPNWFTFHQCLIVITETLCCVIWTCLAYASSFCVSISFGCSVE